MIQISYADLAEVIARAKTPEERQEAHMLIAAYYRLSPVVEPPRYAEALYSKRWKGRCSASPTPPNVL